MLLKVIKVLFLLGLIYLGFWQMAIADSNGMRLLWLLLVFGGMFSWIMVAHYQKNQKTKDQNGSARTPAKDIDFLPKLITFAIFLIYGIWTTNPVCIILSLLLIIITAFRIKPLNDRDK